MVDETRSTESSQNNPTADGSPEAIEELREDDAVADFDLDAAFGNADAGETHEEGTGAPVDMAAIATLESQLKDLKAQLDDRTTQYMRIAADFDNYRKRISKEREDQEFQAKRSTLTELLPVIDNFERARAQIKPQTEAEMTIHKSYQSVYKQLVDCLKRLGVSAMRAEGQEFDPMLHEAVMRQPTAEHPEGTVMEELVRGYLLGDRVLRHAMVKVAAPPEPEEGESAEGGSSDAADT